MNSENGEKRKLTEKERMLLPDVTPKIWTG